MLTVILPTRNEGGALGKVIDEIRMLPLEARIIVTDYKSIDSTREEALSRGVELIDEPQEGKGIAVRNVLGMIHSGDIILMDADHTYPPCCIPDILVELSHGQDVVIGYRCWKEKGSMSFMNRVGNFALSFLASTLYNYRVRDVCSGMWGFKASAVKDFNLTSKGFTLEADFLTNAVKAGHSISQVAIHYQPRLAGKAKLNTWDGFKIGLFLLKRRLR